MCKNVGKCAVTYTCNVGEVTIQVIVRLYQPLLTMYTSCTCSVGVEAIVENLSQQLENSTASESSAQAEDLAAMKLANLRKQVLLQMTSQLHKAEEAGGMRNICFFQVTSCTMYTVLFMIVFERIAFEG